MAASSGIPSRILVSSSSESYDSVYHSLHPASPHGSSSSHPVSNSGSQRPSGRLLIKLYKAKDLPKMSKLLGKINCYCVINLVDSVSSTKKPFKTHTKHSDFSPNFKEDFNRSLDKFSSYPVISLEFYHAHLAGKDDLVGRASIDLSRTWSQSHHPPMYRSRIPIKLEGKLKPSNKAKLSLLLISVGWLPNYRSVKASLEESHRLHTGDGKRITVSLVDELGPGVNVVWEFGKKKCEMYLIQKIEADPQQQWTQIFVAHPPPGQPSKSVKIRRYSGKRNEYWSLKDHSVKTVKKLQDLNHWTHWDRVFLQAFHYTPVFESTYLQIHKPFALGAALGGSSNPSTYEEAKAAVMSTVICNDLDATIYYPLSDGKDRVAFLSSKFDGGKVNTSVWLFQSAWERNLFVDLTYDDKKKRTEVYFKHPKPVHGTPCVMKISLGDVKTPLPRDLFTVRLLHLDSATFQSRSVVELFPNTFKVYPKTKSH